MFCSNCGQDIGEAYIRRLIREELRQLDQETVGKLADQIAARVARTQVYRPHFETKVIPCTEEGKKE